MTDKIPRLEFEDLDPDLAKVLEPSSNAWATLVNSSNSRHINLPPCCRSTNSPKIIFPMLSARAAVMTSLTSFTLKSRAPVLAAVISA